MDSRYSISITKINDGHEKLQFKVTLENVQPAVVPYHKTLGQCSPLSTKQPCMKVILKQTSDDNIYTKLKKSNVERRVLLDVTVTGMTQLHLFNDSREIDHEKPFYPFETYPEIGSHFYRLQGTVSKINRYGDPKHELATGT